MDDPKDERIKFLEDRLREIRKGIQPCDYGKWEVTVIRMVAEATEALDGH